MCPAERGAGGSPEAGHGHGRAEWDPEGSAQARLSGSTWQGDGSWPRCRPEDDKVIVRR